MQQNIESQKIKGSNNGTWGFGMVGSLYSQRMNGPFGNPGYPLPNNNELPYLIPMLETKYNAPGYNGPYYNQEAFRRVNNINPYNINSTFGDGFKEN